MGFLISGIQQIGIGVTNTPEAFKWYNKHFGMNIPVFDEAAEANLMLPYTGGKPHNRHAILALNLVGGGGFEIWQYTSRTPQPPKEKIVLGDLGINILKLKSPAIKRSHDRVSSATTTGVLHTAPNGKQSFFARDPYGNPFQFCEEDSVFYKGDTENGGVFGCTIGVRDIEKSLPFYKDVLGYDVVLADETGIFEAFSFFEGGDKTFRRVILGHSENRKGAFSKLFGPTQLELIQVLDGQPKPILKDRYWGDLGYIHLCFDVKGMEDLRSFCEKHGHPFTVDSLAALKGRFDMGEAAGHFAYIEDPDGTLIEFVEAHKVPLLKKIGWYLDLNKRGPEKPLPNWMIRAMRFTKAKV
ncbi:MAG: VOC family protein [Saprospiraceae bacterium]|nr:VOC family protein [Saprospiraceae bacterium]